MATRVERTSGPARKGLNQALSGMGRRQGQVGWFSSSIYPNGTPVAYVAAIQEFGYPNGNIPPRMGLRGMAKDAQPLWSKAAGYGAKLMVNGTWTIDDALEFIGGVAEGSIRKQIASVISPPLKQSTIDARDRRRASGEPSTATGAKPLVDTGYMLATVTHIVSDYASLTTSESNLT